jgi:outer membrane lipoprotein LolB
MRWLLIFTVVWMLGCASTSGPRPPSETHWEGRMGVRVETSPVQSFTANFSLDGNPSQGSLVLSTPLGTTLATLRWSGQMAELDDGKSVQRYTSLQALISQVLGVELPASSLFAWLQGQSANEPHWEVDSSQLAQGRLRAARRQADLPNAELKIVLTP